jgi:threonine/homoserine/homoserine lactone efflux protein
MYSVRSAPLDLRRRLIAARYNASGRASSDCSRFVGRPKSKPPARTDNYPSNCIGTVSVTTNKLPLSASLDKDEPPMPPLVHAALPAAMTFALAMSITPGPNNTMLLASGVNFGFRRTLPHMIGITFGCMVMMVAIGLGLGQLFERVPTLYMALEAASVAYLLYLAWKIAMSRSLSIGNSDRRPMTFLQAAAFQWVNPKAWMMAVTGVTAFRLSDDLLSNSVLLALAFAIVNLPSISIWAAFGVGMRCLLSNTIVLRAFNWTMAALLVASIMMTFRHGLQ